VPLVELEIMAIINQIGAALFFGFIGGVIPGPILTAVFTEALRKGFLSSLRVIFKAMASESILAFIILATFSLMAIPQYFPYAVSLVGASVLIWFAFQVWKIKDIGGTGVIFSFWKIFFLMFTNGAFWIFWFAISVPQALLLRDAVFGGQFLFLILFEAGWFIGTVGMVFIFSRFRDILIAKKLAPLIFKIFSLALLAFAAKLAIEAVVYLANFSH